MTSIKNRAMLASITVSVWSGRKLDRKATDKVNSDHGANSDVARVNKSLLARTALAEIKQIEGRARTMLYARTLPWMNDGQRILSVHAFDAFARDCRKYEAEFNVAVDNFVAGYPDFVAQARVDMNGLFNESDYPDAAEIRARFNFKRSIAPLSDDADFRVDGMADADAIRAEIAAEFAATMGAAIGDAYKRIAETVGTMASKLAAFSPAKGKGDTSTGIFRDSLVENVRELVDLLPGLNVTNDPKLAEITTRMVALCRYDADALRDDGALRRDIAAQAAEIARDVSDYLA